MLVVNGGDGFFRRSRRLTSVTGKAPTNPCSRFPVSDSCRATASGINAKHQTGTLYAITITRDTATATKLHAFPDLRPEGIAVEPGVARLAVVFDRGKQQPLWIEVDASLLHHYTTTSATFAALPHIAVGAAHAAFPYRAETLHLVGNVRLQGRHPSR